MSVTGVLLTYELQMTEWVDRGFWREGAEAAAHRVPVDDVILAVQEYAPDDEIRSVKRYSDPGAPVAVSVRGRPTVYVDPYEGRVMGEGNQGVRSFFSSMRGWHRWLAVTGDNRSVARAVTGAANLGFLFLVLTGMYLWIPRRWNWGSVKNVLLFNGQLRGKPRDFNWHNVFGIWLAIPLAFVVATAVPISYSWGGRLIYWIAGEEAPVRRAQVPAAEGPAETDGLEALVPLPLESLMARAETQMAGWQAISFSIPGDETSPLALTVDLGNGRIPQKRHTPSSSTVTTPR